MPQIIKKEAWDGVTTPKVPLTWTAAPSFQTSTNLSQSAPNSLRYLGNTNFYENCLYLGSTDQNNGDCQVSAKVYFTGDTSGQAAWFLILRSSADANNCYGVQIEPTNSVFDGVGLYKLVNGSATQLGSTLGTGQILTGGWYYVQLVALATKLTVYVQRLSDLQWLSASGWITYKTTLMVAGDSSIVGAGYFGIEGGQNAGETNPQYLDDFLAENLAPDVALIRRRTRPKQALTPKIKRPKRVRAFGIHNALFRPIGSTCAWSQTDGIAPCGVIQACDVTPPDSGSPHTLARFVNFPGGKPSVLGVGVQVQSYIMQSEQVGLTPNWPGGDWGIRLHVTAVDTSGEFAWIGIRICRLDTSCNSLATIGAVTFPTPIPITIPTIYGTQHVTGAEQDGVNATDSFYVICYFSIQGGLPGNHTITITPDQFIDTPFCGIGPILPDPIDKGQLRWSQSLRRPTRTKRRLRFPPQLLNPQSPQGGSFDPSLFRNKKRSIRFLPVWIRKHYQGRFGRKDGSPGIKPPPADNSALFGKAKRRRPLRSIGRPRRRLRLPPLMQIQPAHAAPMAATALVDEVYFAQGLLLEGYTGTALLTEVFSAQPNVLGVS